MTRQVAIFPKHPRRGKSQPQPTSEALDWITRSLRQELPDEMPDADIQERAEVLHAIACNWNVPIEGLITWIHSDAPAKEWSGGEFRRWCEWYRARERGDADASGDVPRMKHPTEHTEPPRVTLHAALYARWLRENEHCTVQEAAARVIARYPHTAPLLRRLADREPEPTR